MKKKLLLQSKLYCVLDYAALHEKCIVSAASDSIKGGADIIQVRFKNIALSRVIKDACLIAKLSEKTKTIFLVNDRVDIALLCNADGVHLGHLDMPYALARKLLGKNKIIGLSTHSLKEAVLAQKQGADYISVGPIFATPTKPEYKAVGLSLIKKIKAEIKIPLVAIGGINHDNLIEVLNAGAERIAVVRAICKARDIRSTTQGLKLKLASKNF